MLAPAFLRVNPPLSAVVPWCYNRPMVADPRVGSELAGHRILAVIGRGGMAVVYLAEHLRLGRRVAMKVLDPEMAEDEAFRERFIRESRIAARLDHPNVVTVYDAGEADAVLFLSMRYVEGTDLERLLRSETKLDPERAVSIVSQCAAALDAAHRGGLVHRDVKPADILLESASDAGDRVFLSDFGISKQLSPSTRLTRTGSLMGTVDYVAPEQIRGEHVDGRADVYSLGCVLYRCLTGEVPFPRNSEITTIYAHLNDPAPGPSEHREGLPAGFDGVIKRALAKSSDERFPTCGSLADALTEALEAPDKAVPVVAADLTAVEHPLNRLRLRTATIAAVLAVASIAFVGGLLARAWRGSEPATSPSPQGEAPVVGRTGPFVIAAAGEIACPSPPFSDTNPDACQYDDTADLIHPSELAAVLALGDNQYDTGDYEDYLTYYDAEWGRAKSITKPVPGNHDYVAPPPATPVGYFRYFGESVAGPQGQGYYSFDLGACPDRPCWHFIALNSQLCVGSGGCGPARRGTEPSAGNQMYRWLRHDLATHPNKEYPCTLAYWHHPLFSFSTGSGATPEVRPLWELLYASHADVVLNGHSHNYQRWKPQDPAQRAEHDRGIRQFVVGTGGSTKSFLQPGTWPANLVAAQDSAFGILKISLRRSSYGWTWVSANGQPDFSDASTNPARCS
jgi:tRNA A-37 threonylcarbamoyl transferase component Bud32